FAKIFKEEGLQEAFSNVIAFVVQPGVEEKDSGCVEYDRAKAAELMAEIRKYPNIVFEGHSTDYQTQYKLREMVEDGVGILKVGPGLTFALREGLYALSFIEDELVEEEKRSHFREVLDEAMLENPKYWQKHYHGTDEEVAFKRRYSFSDRCRYYYANSEVEESIEKLFRNLKGNIPWNLLSQFMPVQYDRVREGTLENDPEALVIDRIGDTIDHYMFATGQQEL
ncbi:MAG: class II D-tagatose-bisphosphate aldolase, non-catalytic subunit, partial [Erysipelotrichaceae bacterium]|nr:class II D-tagatose-bisphosphate aldolase, non-catalytic subunit [Erysipelotrichaceae bacterium]